jgi:hypothetical protein
LKLSVVEEIRRSLSKIDLFFTGPAICHLPVRVSSFDF